MAGPKRWIGFVFAVALFLVAWWSPVPLDGTAHKLLAVFLCIVVLWVSEALPMAATALLIAPLMVLTGVCDAKAAFAPYADPILFVFIGGFMIARAMTRHGLDRRIALTLLSLPGIGTVPWRVRVGVVLTGALLSMWISNVATTAIIIPILLGMTPPSDKGGLADKATAGSLLAVAYGNSIGGLGTPFGSPPNLIAIRFLRERGVEFSFVDWVSIALPVVTILTVAMLLLFQRLSPPVSFGNTAVERPTSPSSRGEKVTALSFALAVCGWMAPGILRASGLPGADVVGTMLPAGAVGVLAASILFVFSDEKGVHVLPWPEANRIDWGIIILFGGGLSLGRQMFDTGLAEALSLGFVQVSGVSDVWTLTALVIVFTIVFTETCSNTATSNMLAPLVIAVSDKLEVSPVPAVLGMALAASCAFMLPIATGPNAMVYGTGRITQAGMMKAGFLLNMAAAVLIYLVLRLLLPLYGWVPS